jgi:multidrug efflux system outer membrane protein
MRCSRQFRWAIAGCALPWLGACSSPAVNTTARLPFEIPAVWSNNSDSMSSAAALTAWWSRFNDRLLSNLVNQAGSANNSIGSAQAALRQARALRDVTAAGLGPVLGSSASAQRARSGSNGTANSLNVGLDASWELDVFGANRSGLDSSQATLAASAATLGNIQVSIAAEVALAYIAFRNAQTRQQIATDNLASQQETQQLTDWRLQAGLVTSLEAEQARASVEQTHAQLPLLQTAIEQNRHALAVLTGQPPAALNVALAASAPVPQVVETLALGFPADTLRQRPDVRAAEFQVSSAVALVRQAEAARAPDFKLNGSLGLNALTLGGLSNGSAVFASLMGGVSLPIFDGGAARARVRSQQAALDQAQSAYQSTVLTALKDVEDALIALRSDRERSASLQQAANAATNAALLARQRYDSGLVDFQTVLETQRTRLATQDSVASATADVSADHVRLYKALGGGWIPDGTITVNRLVLHNNSLRTQP